MLLESLEDELTEAPVYARPSSPAPPVAASVVADTQEQRLVRLERELRCLRADMQRGSAGSVGGNTTTTTTATTTATTTTAQLRRRSSSRSSSTSSSSSRPSHARKHSSDGGNNEHVDTATRATTTSALPPRLDEAVDCELRRAVSHLSPTFACSTRDALLLLSAIRHGGDAHTASGHSSNGSSNGSTTLADRLHALTAEHRALEQRLAKKVEECDVLRDELAAARQRLQATQEQARQRAALLSQRNEELRRQLLLEETRTEKMHIRNSALERENDKLKARLHDRLR